MSEIDDLIKLNELREKNILTREEFEEQKAKLLGTSGQTDKEGGLSSQSAGNTTDKGSKADKACLNTEEKTVNRVMYIILGIFFGLFGIHNFYAGYKGRGIAKILLSILIVPILFVELWVLIELVVTKTDGKGRLMEESATPVRILPIIFLIIYSLSLFFIVFVGGMAGYSSARRRIAENRALDDLMLAVVNVREISSGGNYENIENIAAQIGLLDNLNNSLSDISGEMEVRIQADPETPAYFNLVFDNMDTQFCKRIASFDWGEGSYIGISPTEGSPINTPGAMSICEKYGTVYMIVR